MEHLDLPHRIFADRAEPAGDRVNQYFKLNTIRVVLKALTPSDIDRIRPFFGKILDIYSKPVFSGKLAHFLLTRQLDVVRRHEIWCIFAGKPIRFSLHEFCMVTGLNCNPLPPLDPALEQCPPGVTPYWFTLFGGNESITGEKLIAKLRRPKSLSDELRLKYACLVLVDGLLCRRSFHMKIPKKHVEMIRDLDVFLNYPWGRYSFDMTMKSIKNRSRDQLAQATVVIQGFIHGLVLLFVEAVPAVLSATGNETDPESGEEEDLPVVSLKLDKVWDLDHDEKVQVLSIIPSDNGPVGDFSYPDEVPDPGVDAIMQLIEQGTDFTRDMFVGGDQVPAAPVLPPARAVKKGKRKVNANLVADSSQTSRSKKSKGSSSRSMSAPADPQAKLLVAVSKQIRDGMKESQAVVYANICIEIKAMEDRIQKDIRQTVNESVADCMKYKETIGSVLEGLDGEPAVVGGGRKTTPPQVGESLVRSDIGSSSDSRKDHSVDLDGSVAVGATLPDAVTGKVEVRPSVPDVVDVGGVGGDTFPDAPCTLVSQSCPEFRKLTETVDQSKVLDFDGFLLKESELLNIPVIIPPDHPQVMDACVSVIRHSLVENIDPHNDTRADMLPCKFYGTLAVVFSKFSNSRRKEAFNFPDELVTSVGARFSETGKQWLKDIDYIYSPFNIDKNRWVGLVVNMSDHSLTVLDCTAAVRRGSRLKPELEFICQMFPYFVRQVGANALMTNYSLKPLSFVRNTHVCQATDRANTGILSLLLMEAHACGGSEGVRLVNENGIRLRAEQLAVEMYEH